MSRFTFRRFAFLMSFGVVLFGPLEALASDAVTAGIKNGSSDLVESAPQSTDAQTALVADATTTAPSARGNFVVTSTDLHADHPIASAQVYSGMGCDGQNQSPELSWTGVPKGTKTLAITMYDPDAPTGSGWWHWVVFNIPADVTSLPAGAGDSSRKLLPPGATLGNTDFGTAGYGGPCPPKGDKPHRYLVTVFALDDSLSIPGNATAAYVGFNIHAHTIGKATLSALYGR
jgi:Raf kinase inhibitor-like YbhB/YbcL family protein